MIRINLLPHREAKRKQNKIAFFRLLVVAGVFGVAVVGAVGLFIETRISEQEARNAYITAENKKLDKQIEEIATLKQDIEALKARQQAVEDLQSDRNQPVYLLDELVKQVPEGVFLRSFKQEGQKVSMSGVAQSNERVSELLHNFGNNSQWLERPELIESKSGTIGTGRDLKKIFEFTMTVGIKRPRDLDKEKKDANGKPIADADKAKEALEIGKALIPNGTVIEVKPSTPAAASASNSASASAGASAKAATPAATTPAPAAASAPAPAAAPKKP
jgi:type IV pilus assembly protein PilN